MCFVEAIIIFINDVTVAYIYKMVNLTRKITINITKQF